MSHISKTESLKNTLVMMNLIHDIFSSVLKMTDTYYISAPTDLKVIYSYDLSQTFVFYKSIPEKAITMGQMFLLGILMISEVLCFDKHIVGLIVGSNTSCVLGKRILRFGIFYLCENVLKNKKIFRKFLKIVVEQEKVMLKAVL